MSHYRIAGKGNPAVKPLTLGKADRVQPWSLMMFPMGSPQSDQTTLGFQKRGMMFTARAVRGRD